MLGSCPCLGAQTGLCCASTYLGRRIPSVGQCVQAHSSISSRMICCVHRKEIAGMSKTIELTDEQYATLASTAARDGETPQRFIERLLNALTQTQGTIHYSDDELLRALGADDQELSKLEEL